MLWSDLPTHLVIQFTPEHLIGRAVIEDKDHLLKVSLTSQVLKDLANHYSGTLIKRKPTDTGT